MTLSKIQKIPDEHFLSVAYSTTKKINSDMTKAVIKDVTTNTSSMSLPS